MRQLIALTLFAVVVGSITLGAATMATIIVTNASDSMIQITPIDDTHKPPAPLDQISTTLTPGSFILTNQTSTPINAVITLWSFTDRNGSTQQRRFNCDGYVSGVAENVVRANDSALITPPDSCTMREYFGHLATGKPVLRGSLFFSTNKPISEIVDPLGTVRISIDSVIFEDGRIWGPDTKQYYKTVSSRYWAVRSVVEEVSTARAAGQEMKVPLERILAEPGAGGDQPSHERKICARTIHDSPNPEGTLKFYSQQAPLPEFKHIGEQTK